MIKPLDAVDALELAELLNLTADAISWPNATVIHADLQAHLRRWARRLEPNSTNRTPDEPARPTKEDRP